VVYDGMKSADTGDRHEPPQFSTTPDLTHTDRDDGTVFS
jgi:hypothetical protein